MPIFYNKVKRKNPSSPSDPAKWYPVLRSVGMLKEKDVAKQIADETTLNPKEAEMALAQFEKILLRSLLNGQSVQLGDWGSFHLTVRAEGSDTEEEVTPNKIKKLHLRFTPSKSIKEALAQAEIRSVKQLSNK